MPIFSCQPLTWQGELTHSPTSRQWSGMSHSLRSQLGPWDSSGTDLCGKGLSCGIKSQSTGLVVPPLMVESLDSTCWVIKGSLAQNSTSSPE